MRLPSTAVLLLILLIPLAGCSGIFGTAPQESRAFAPGVTSERVTEPSTLAAANRAILQNTSYTYVQNYTQRVETDSYHYAANHDTSVWVTADGSFLYHHRGVVTSDSHSSAYIDEVWANESLAVMRTVNVLNKSVTYTRYRPPEPFSATNATQSDISGALGDADVTARWNESSSKYVRVRANKSETRRWQTANDTTAVLTRSPTATATIREDGFIPLVNTSISSDRPLPVALNDSIPSTGRPIVDVFDRTRVRYEALGTTDVPSPTWIDKALSATNGFPLGETTIPRAMNASV